jgi:hypothetical protein
MVTTDETHGQLRTQVAAQNFRQATQDASVAKHRVWGYEHRRQGTMHSASTAPDYVWKGKLFLSIEDAARRGGDGGAKLSLGLYKSARFIRLIFETKEVYHFHQVAFEAKKAYEISFDEIGDIKSVSTPIPVVLVGVRNDDFPPNEVILYIRNGLPSTLRDVLREAIASDRQIP